MKSKIFTIKNYSDEQHWEILATKFDDEDIEKQVLKNSSLESLREEPLLVTRLNKGITASYVVPTDWTIFENDALTNAVHSYLLDNFDAVESGSTIEWYSYKDVDDDIKIISP